MNVDLINLAKEHVNVIFEVFSQWKSAEVALKFRNKLFAETIEIIETFLSVIGGVFD